MVVALGPGRFYGSALPRPRYYEDVKLGPERVDPPVGFTDPLLSWAREAHWSMGGLSFERHRLQGRIEGSIARLRAQSDDIKKKKEKKKTTTTYLFPNPEPEEDDETKKTINLLVGSGHRGRKKRRLARSKNRSPSPVSPPMDPEITDPDAEDSEDEDVTVDLDKNRIKRARRLGDEFDRVAQEEKEAIASRTRSRTPVKKEIGGDESAPTQRRTSPRTKQHP